MPGAVVKVGGSLFADPALGPRLRAWLAGQPGRVTLVAGGGPFADAVRALDAVHRLGDRAAHDLAVESLRASAALLGHLAGGAADVLDVPGFLADYEAAAGPVPASWDVTTDSLAGYAAGHLGRPLVLLKSVAIPPGTPWDAAAAAGWVDAHFPAVVARFKLAVTAVNFRRAAATGPGSGPA